MKKILLWAGALVFLAVLAPVLSSDVVLGLLGSTLLLGHVTAIPEAEFQTKVLEGIEAQKTKTDKLVSDFERLDTSTKKTFEEITQLKKTANDSAADFTKLQTKLTQVEHQLRREARMAFGDPIQRISRDEEMRLRLNAAVRMAVADPSGDFVRLVRGKFPSEFVKRALGEDSSPGSTLIDDALANEIYDTLASFGVWNTFGVRRMGTKITKFPVKTARAVANFVLTEGGTIADDANKTGTSLNLEVEVIAALINVSLQLLQDAEFDVTADVLDDFGEAYAYRLDWAALQADGGADATDGGMTGVFGGGGTAAVAASGNVSTETLDEDDVRKCLLTVDAAVLSRPCRWWMHPQILIRLLAIKDLNGRPIFLTAQEAPTPGGIGTIYGYPVTLAHAAPSANTVSSRLAVFGDPNGQVVGVRQDFTFEASDHHRWNTFERSFRGVGRAGTKIRRAQAFAVLTTAAS